MQINTIRRLMIGIVLSLVFLKTNSMNKELNEDKKTESLELINAIKSGSFKESKELIEKGVDLDVQDDKGNTALICAIIKHQSDIAILLIKKGVKLELRDEHGATALIYAIIEHQFDIFKRLIDRGANVHHQGKGKTTPLMVAVYQNEFEMVKILIESGADINAQNNYKRSALFLALQGNRLNIAQFLIESGANLNMRYAFCGSHYITPLMWAIREKQTEITELMIAKGANLNMQALEDTYFRGRRQKIESDTALMMAVRWNEIDVIKLLIAKNANLNIQNKDGSTALIIAIKNQKMSEIATLLIKHGADLDIQDNENHTALWHAQNKGLTEIATLLTDLRNFPYNDEKAITVFNEIKQCNPAFAVPALKMLYENKKNYRHIMHCIGLCNEYKSTSNLLKKLMKEERLLLTLDREVLDKMNLVYDEKTVNMCNKLVLRNQDSDLCDINIIYFQNTLL